MPLAADAMPRRGLARNADGAPTKKTQQNFTDSDSHLMHSGVTYLQGYNYQVADDSDHQVIVAVGVSNQPPGVEHLDPMLQRIAASAGALPTLMTMDAGYSSEDNTNACAEQGIDAYIAAGRLPHGQPPPPKRGHCPEVLMPKPACPQDQEQERCCDLRPAQGNRGASERADQGRSGLPEFPVAGH